MGNFFSSWFSKNAENDIQEEQSIEIKNSNNNIIEVHNEHLNVIKSIKLYFEILFLIIFLMIIVFIIYKLRKFYKKRTLVKKSQREQQLRKEISMEMLNKDTARKNEQEMTKLKRMLSEAELNV